ncbi:MAG TPA: 4,5-DOPA dioxygenase extradiol [Candidatus Kapabacteria bacterium]|nr:4,5-DOPA dioxygenase extradiol [Candidatus Kapabacteria bacterium]
MGITAAMAMTTREMFGELNAKKGERMPVVFIGHGSPMNALEDNPYTRSWHEIARKIPTPSAILSVSAHWLTHGTHVTSMEHPKTIHDFYGFPQKLATFEYPAPGSPKFADETKKLITSTEVGLDANEWGLDHGTWSVLTHLYPKADVPVYQLSIDFYQPGQYHYDLAKELRSLREKGVLIIGSGNIVHNLRMMRSDGGAYDWATEFDAKVKELLDKGDHKSLIEYQDLGSAAQLSVPTPDHYYPLLYTMGISDEKDKHMYYNEGADLGSVSMRSVFWTDSDLHN